MRVVRCGGAGLLGLGFVLWASAASAQDAAAAGALFDKGVADMQAGHFDSGCPALEESQQMDPHPGTLFTLAECQAKWGKVASAVAHYQDYVGVVSRLPADQKARHHQRVVTANAQLAKLKPSVPTLTLVLPERAPKGTVVSRDGAQLQSAALGLALPVDPGPHAVVTRVPGGQDHLMTVTVALGEAKRVPLEVDDSVAAVGATPVAASVAHEAPTSTDAPPEPGASKSGHTAAYVAGGIGIAGIVVGSVTGIMVLGKHGTVKDSCTDHTCSADGVSAANSGKTLAIVSDIGFGVGIAGLATGAILLLTNKPEPTATSRGWQPLVAGTLGGAWAGVGRHW